MYSEHPHPVSRRGPSKSATGNCRLWSAYAGSVPHAEPPAACHRRSAWQFPALRRRLGFRFLFVVVVMAVGVVVVAVIVVVVICVLIAVAVTIINVVAFAASAVRHPGQL